MIISIRQILLIAAVVIFVLDALNAWRFGINPLPLGLALAFGCAAPNSVSSPSARQSGIGRWG